MGTIFKMDKNLRLSKFSFKFKTPKCLVVLRMYHTPRKHITYRKHVNTIIL
jgi:hypothetical protein